MAMGEFVYAHNIMCVYLVHFLSRGGKDSV